MTHHTASDLFHVIYLHLRRTRIQAIAWLTKDTYYNISLLQVVLNYGNGRVPNPPFVQQAQETRSIIGAAGSAAVLSAAGWSGDRRIWRFPGLASLPGPNAGLQLRRMPGKASSSDQ